MAPVGKLSRFPSSICQFCEFCPNFVKRLLTNLGLVNLVLCFNKRRVCLHSERGGGEVQSDAETHLLTPGVNRGSDIFRCFVRVSGCRHAAFRTCTVMTYTPALRLPYRATVSWSSVIITTSIMPARWSWYHTAAEYTHLNTHTHRQVVHNMQTACLLKP